MKNFDESQADVAELQGQRIAILGYGSQGRAQALNLRDSGLDVVIGLRDGSPREAIARDDGFDVAAPGEAVTRARVVALLVPDLVLGKVYESVADSIDVGTALVLGHGFAVHYGLLDARDDLDVILVAPKGGPGRLVRRYYEQGYGVPCLIAVRQDASGRAIRRALAYAAGISGAYAGLFETTFGEEAETDMFGEQAVLCGGMTELVLAGFETLVEAGYQPEIAYFEVLHELKLVIDLMHEGGLAQMHEGISDTAAWGCLVSGPRVIGDDVRAGMRSVLEEIRGGRFARRWIDEHAGGMQEFEARRDAQLAHPVEAVGRQLRQRMRWLSG